MILFKPTPQLCDTIYEKVISIQYSVVNILSLSSSTIEFKSLTDPDRQPTPSPTFIGTFTQNFVHFQLKHTIIFSPSPYPIF